MGDGAVDDEPWQWCHSDRPASQVVSAILTRGQISIAIAFPRSLVGANGTAELEASVRSLLRDATTNDWVEA